MGGSITLHREKGLNPKLTVCQCPVRGKDHDGNELVFVGARDYKQTCPKCKCVCYGGFDRKPGGGSMRKVCPKCDADCEGLNKEPLGEYEKLRMPPEPCGECAGYMKQGIIILSVKDGDPDYRTGGFWVLKEEAVKQIMDGNPEMLADVLKRRVCLMEDSVCEKLGLTKAVKKEVDA